MSRILSREQFLHYLKTYSVSMMIFYDLGIRANINIGNITHYDVMTVLPFDTRLLITKLTGKEILATLENTVRR